MQFMVLVQWSDDGRFRRLPQSIAKFFVGCIRRMSRMDFWQRNVSYV